MRKKGERFVCSFNRFFALLKFQIFNFIHMEYSLTKSHLWHTLKISSFTICPASFSGCPISWILTVNFHPFRTFKDKVQRILFLKLLMVKRNEIPSIGLSKFHFWAFSAYFNWCFLQISISWRKKMSEKNFFGEAIRWHFHLFRNVKNEECKF